MRFVDSHGLGFDLWCLGGCIGVLDVLICGGGGGKWGKDYSGVFWFVNSHGWGINI